MPPSTPDQATQPNQPPILLQTPAHYIPGFFVTSQQSGQLSFNGTTFTFTQTNGTVSFQCPISELGLADFRNGSSSFVLIGPHKKYRLVFYDPEEALFDMALAGSGRILGNAGYLVTSSIIDSKVYPQIRSGVEIAMLWWQLLQQRVKVKGRPDKMSMKLFAIVSLILLAVFIFAYSATYTSTSKSLKEQLPDIILLLVLYILVMAISIPMYIRSTRPRKNKTQ